jgi:hypothetical protein
MNLRSSLLLVAAVCTSCALLPSSSSSPDLAKLSSHLAGAVVSNVEAFQGEEMYNYMDGAAVTYLEHGRVQLTAADVQLDGISSKVELYTLASPEAAGSVYSAFAKSEGGEALACGVAGTLWPSTEPEAIFRRGCHFVRVMTYAADVATGKRVATAVAKAVDGLLVD